jgi:hypothetical protein
MTPTERMALALETKLTASLNDFEASMRRAGDLAEQQARTIEKTFASASPNFNAAALTASLAGLAGFAGGAGITKLLDQLASANKQLSDTPPVPASP